MSMIRNVPDLQRIAELADEEVLNSRWAKKHGIVLVSQISNGGCELWANAVVKRLPGSRKVWIYRHKKFPGGTKVWTYEHCVVEWNGRQFDSDIEFE